MIILERNNSDVYLMDGQISSIDHRKEDSTAKVRFTDGNVVTYIGVRKNTWQFSQAYQFSSSGWSGAANRTI